MTVSNTGAFRNAPAGSPIHTTLPRGRTYYKHPLAYARFESSHSTYLSSLLEGLLRDSDEDDSVGPKAVRRGSLHLLDDILAGGEVDESLRAQRLTHLLLLVAGVDGNDVQAHSLRVLLRQRPQPAARAHNRDRLTRPRSRFLQAFVHGDARAQHRRHRRQVHVFAQPRHVRGLRDGVLLERAVDGVAREERVRAELLAESAKTVVDPPLRTTYGLVGLLAEVAGQARAVDPLDADVVAELDVLDEVAFRDDDARAFVPAHERELGGQRPVAVYRVQVRVADACPNVRNLCYLPIRLTQAHRST